ncbi:MAG: hypothetical protein Hyperionvirus4_154 [Hyperionvirus sp.]|uniref:C2H2-type domain-containing protein n=1 Tax=Hyperionvirus sp. TaxID=2487770 RepID=A0A3G5ACW1_9VIRU|nr:MAG: hypothetical protein Hyperionvirus4_154 [Hyperionvirus sp.]
MAEIMHEQLTNEGNKQNTVAKAKTDKCPSCQLFETGGDFCEYCVPFPIKKLYHKTKEYIVLDFLQINLVKELGDKKLVHNKSVGCQCTGTHLYPDFRIDCGYYFLIIEVDEFEHKYGNYTCEDKRMYDIVAKIGMRCIFIRYNPDNKISDINVLLETIKKYLVGDIDSIGIPWDYKNLIVIYLFYTQHKKISCGSQNDGDDETNDYPKSKKKAGRQNYRCEICDYSTDRKGNIVRHLISPLHRRKISGRGKSVVDVVDKVVDNVVDEYRYRCGQCEYKCKDRSNFHRHKLMHEGVEYNCDQCSFTTKDRSSLKKHMCIHTGKEYECLACSMTFRDMIHLEVHLGSRNHKSNVKDKYPVNLKYASIVKNGLRLDLD